MTMMSLETDCLPIRNKIDNGSEIDNEGTTTSIDRQEIKDASSSCDFCANFAERFCFLHAGVFTTVNDECIDLLRKINTEKMLLHRKLHLVINLDHTVLTHTNVSDLTPEEEYLKSRTDLQDVFIVQVPPKMKPMIIKFRPFLRTFLKEASKFFEIYAYTNAPRSLAWKIVELLDPTNEYFGRRVILPEYFCSTHQGSKGLDFVIGQESTVVVVDDKLDGWKEESQNNVTLLRKYCFFKRKCGHKKHKSLCELKSDDRAGYLARTLIDLKRIHSRFFNDDVMCDNLFERDVRMLLKIEWDPLVDDGRRQLWKKALSNYMRKKVVTSLGQQKKKKMAEQLSGATCVEDQVDDPSSVVVAEGHVGTSSPANWLHPSWIDMSIRLWRKSHADKFPVITEHGKFTCSSCGCSSYWNTGISLGSEREEDVCPSELAASFDPFVSRES